MSDYSKKEPDHITQQEAHYREGSPAEHCGICTMFRSPNRCTYVLGHISAAGTCDYFDPE